MRVIPKHRAKCVTTGWLTANESVIVLAISYASSVGSRFLLWSNRQKNVALFSTAEFEIVDQQMSRAWVASIDLNGNVEFGPIEWLEGDFWDRFHSGDAEAERIFNECVKRIEQC